MTRRLTALLLVLALLLTALPAAAEATSAAYAPPLEPFDPATEDFLGEWTLLYVISGGSISPEAAANFARAIVITEEGVFGRIDEEQSPLYPYEITGSVLVADGIAAALIAPDLMLVDGSPAGTVIYHRTVRADNPFIGDWQVFLSVENGLTDYTGADDTFLLRFGEHSVALGDGVEWFDIPCIYRDGVCVVEPEGANLTLAIDQNGLMTLTREPYGVLYLLLRVQ